MLYKILICIINIVIHMKDRSESETLCTILQKITNTQCIISSIFHQLFPYVITLFWNTESQFLKKKKNIGCIFSFAASSSKDQSLQVERDQLGEFNAGKRYHRIVWFAEETLCTLVLYNTYVIPSNAVFR